MDDDLVQGNETRSAQGLVDDAKFCAFCIVLCGAMLLGGLCGCALDARGALEKTAQRK